MTRFRRRVSVLLARLAVRIDPDPPLTFTMTPRAGGYFVPGSIEEQERALTDALAAQKAAARATRRIEEYQVTKTLADLISGHIVGRTDG